jgi:hypothetical protein
MLDEASEMESTDPLGSSFCSSQMAVQERRRC